MCAYGFRSPTPWSSTPHIAKLFQKGLAILVPNIKIIIKKIRIGVYFPYRIYHKTDRVGFPLFINPPGYRVIIEICRRNLVEGIPEINLAAKFCH